MEEEIKKAYMDWSEKGVSYLNCMYVYDIMMDVDEALQTCDTILDEIDLGIDYTSRKKDIDRLLANPPEKVEIEVKYKIAVTVMELRFWLKDCELPV